METEIYDSALATVLRSGTALRVSFCGHGAELESNEPTWECDHCHVMSCQDVQDLNDVDECKCCCWSC